MPAKLSQQDFEALIRRAGLTLTPEQVDVLYGGWAFVEPMLERVREGAIAREAEPLLIYRPELA